MKSAVALNAEAASDVRDAALDQLRVMLQLYLRAQLEA
jgi:hypothetical protein